MNEIVPGIFHWSTPHPDIRIRVSSHYVAPAGILVDPLEPEDGMGFFDELDPAPQQIVLTSGLHWRHSDRFRDRYGATVRVVEQGLGRWEGTDRSAEPFGFGDEVAPEVTAVEIDAIAPDDTALHISHGKGAVILADALTHYDGTVAFVPDSLMDDPEKTKQGLRDSLRGLLEREWDALLFAHGEPIAEGGRERLTEFLSAS